MVFGVYWDVTWYMVAAGMSSTVAFVVVLGVASMFRTVSISAKPITGSLLLARELPSAGPPPSIFRLLVYMIL